MKMVCMHADSYGCKMCGYTDISFCYKSAIGLINGTSSCKKHNYPEPIKNLDKHPKHYHPCHYKECSEKATLEIKLEKDASRKSRVCFEHYWKIKDGV